MNTRTFLVILAALCHTSAVLSRCRTQPGDSTFPSSAEWNALNSSVDGRLLATVPSARECSLLNCTEAEWTSAVFRVKLPGQAFQYNWEQDYAAAEPELCLRNGTACAQGNVPVFAINATSAEHVQTGIRFASEHNLRIAVKSSGHDYLGRSTAKGSLLIWVHYMQDISFTESFSLSGRNFGSAVTAGSGVSLHNIYVAAQQAGKIVVGGTATTVAMGGGYVQGAGHSAFSQLFGLAADNALEFQIVLASGELVTVNEVSHPDLFWAIRGGGAGSWGVIVSVTVRTYPTFNATQSSVTLAFPSVETVGPIMTAHSRHIFDWEPAGQYYTLGSTQGGTFVEIKTLFTNKTAEESIALLSPFFDEALELGATILSNTTDTLVVNELVTKSDDSVGHMEILGSRLIPRTAYQNNPDAIGQALGQLVEKGYVISGNMVGGGQLSLNANISSAINPKWRTAKGHIVAVMQWNESTPLNEIEALRENMTTWAVPLLANVTGEADSGSYSNEADVREPDFQTTFFGGNYARLSTVKATYDPDDLFIVGAGVGSERWDAYGLCTA